MNMSTDRIIEDAVQIPDKGSVVKTNRSEIEGKVERVVHTKNGSQEVYFRLADGRLMKAPVENLTIIEKLADEEIELNEYANSTISKDEYLSRRKELQRIQMDPYTSRNPGLKKQLAQEIAALSKRAKESNLGIAIEEQILSELTTDLLARYKTAAGKQASDADSKGNYKMGDKRFHGIVRATNKQFDNDKKKVKEGGEGGINRSAPSNDVSFEKILNDVTSKWKNQRTKVTELKAETELNWAQLANKYRDAETAKFMQSGYLDPKVVDKTDRRADRTIKIHNKHHGLNNRQQDEAIDMSQFADILKKQHKDVVKPAQVKTKEIPLSNANFFVLYRPQTDNLKPLRWQIRDKRVPGDIKYDGSSSNIKDAVNSAEEWLATKSTGNASSNHVTVNFNAEFAKTFANDGETLYCDIWEGPVIVFSLEPQKGFKKTDIRTQEHRRSQNATLLPVMGLSPKAANAVGLDGNSRYKLGKKLDAGDDVIAYQLIWDSKVEAGVRMPRNYPILQTSTKVKD